MTVPATTLLLSETMRRQCGDALQAIAARCGRRLALLDPEAAEADPALLAAVDCAWFSYDVFGGGPSASAATRRLFALVDRASNLRWLHVMSAGTDMPLYRASIERGVRLSTASGITAVPIAHTVIGALLAQARGFPGWLQAQRERRWAPRTGAEAPRDLAGQCAVIVGMGPIGCEIARLARALGLRTVGVRRQAQALDGVDRTAVYDELPGLMPHCDWLVLCCPLTERTRGLVDAALLARLPAHARLLNVGRGAVVDEGALVDALQSGRLAGAYLDVFAQEPLAADSPLWDLPGVWLSPHNAAASSGHRARDTSRFLEAFEAHLATGD